MNVCRMLKWAFFDFIYLNVEQSHCGKWDLIEEAKQNVYMHNLWVSDSLTWVIPEQNKLICGSFFILSETPFHVVPRAL